MVSLLCANILLGKELKIITAKEANNTIELAHQVLSNLEVTKCLDYSEKLLSYSLTNKKAESYYLKLSAVLNFLQIGGVLIYDMRNNGVTILIAVTAYEKDQIAEDIFSIGFKDIINKPFDSQVLYEILYKYIILYK